MIAEFDGLRRLRVRAALGRFAGRAHRMAATLGATFATTVRMVDRVHGRAADVGADALPTVAAGLADDDRVMCPNCRSRRSSPGRRPARGGLRRWAD